MSFNHEIEYKKNIKKYVQSIKTTPEEKNTKMGKKIRELKQECLSLLDKVSEFGYKPNVHGNVFYVTESTVGMNKKDLSFIEQLLEIKIFISSFIKG